MAAPMSALVVEDDEQIAYLLQFILKREGYVVKVVRDGRSAQAVIVSDPPPAIVTLDIMLPHVDGFELIAAIRAHDGWEKVPILMLTARAQEKDVVRALEAGAD